MIFFFSRCCGCSRGRSAVDKTCVTVSLCLIAETQFLFPKDVRLIRHRSLLISTNETWIVHVCPTPTHVMFICRSSLLRFTGSTSVPLYHFFRDTYTSSVLRNAYTLVYAPDVPHLPLRQSPSPLLADLRDAQKVAMCVTTKVVCVRAYVRACTRAYI